MSIAVAALYDIHGNLPALRAVLEEIQDLKVKEIVVGGDVLVGPMSRECLELLLSIQTPVHFIFGNCEVSVLDAMRNKPLPPLPETVLKDIQWTANELSPEHHRIVSAWPKTIELEVKGIGRVLFCHATPQDENQIFTKLTPHEELLPLFKEIDVDLVVCGHTHMQFDLNIGTTRIINAGSIGMPFGKSGAHWLLLDNGIEFKHTLYDLGAAAHLISKTSYPSATNFAQKNVLQPPSEDEMLSVFTKRHDS